MPAALRPLTRLETRAWLAVAGVVAWMAALAVAGSAIAQRSQLLAMREAVAQSALIAQRRRPPSSLRAQPALPPAEGFRAAFALADTRQQRLEGLLDAVERHGLRWQRSDLRQTREVEISLLRYQVTLPLVGSYGAVRSLIDDALAADPGLSLDRLRVSRRDARSAALDVDTTWSLWMQARDVKQRSRAEGRRP
jgi:hypothetical protein